VQFARTATYDNNTESSVLVTTNVHGSNVDIVFSFNSAQNSIWYDPQVTVATGAATSASSFLLSFIHALLV
jgi:hypothetical protein